ncbi:putative NAD(P)-dependent oxidoreductase, GFO/IDH/MOCA family [Bradyrhizobium sp. ORS 278]|uniref:Gfo/Idh/MocA family protein n=1 Tax=Bradyrhizobium sp. (strain ORS 278) TaxID=114615 RepID=UPI00015088CD|nr:Gfo/Idh/MocA family oxidoreductase [Bradyrhizobium sp. ORS 278]CAL78880.1 putative NAD(P)-dependent oxidoreductase, GFO/IDH/MOCA family [Bradyrhizobium sp. ORS 278]
MRVAVVGYGYWGPNLVRNFSAHPDFEVAAIVDANESVRQRASTEQRGIRVVADFEEIARDASIEVVAIATPVATHFSLASRALLAGKHVIVEKPMCASVAECQELTAIAHRANRVLMVDHTFLFTGAVQMIKQLAQRRELGDICYFDSMRVNLGLFQQDVNCLWDLAPHDLSIIDYLLEDEVVGIDASSYCHLNPGFPDMVYVTLHFARNTVAHLNLSWMSPVKVRRIAVGGTKQMLVWDDLDQDQKIRVYNSGIEYLPADQRNSMIPQYRIGDIYSPRLPKTEALAGVVDHFSRVIRGDENSILSPERGTKIVRILEMTQKILDGAPTAGRQVREPRS